MENLMESSDTDFVAPSIFARKGTQWTAEEMEIVIREYPLGGPTRVMPLLPHRSRDAIRGKADYLQVRIAGRPYIRQPTTELIDGAIRRAYLAGAPDLKKLSREWNRTHGWIKWRALNLGVSRARPGTMGGPWLPEEDALLEKYVDRELGVKGLYNAFRRAGYRRSMSAILSRMETLLLRFSRSWWTAREVAQLFATDEHVVAKWIVQGKLKATKTSGQGRVRIPDPDARDRQWKIEPDAVKVFMLSHPDLWDHRKMRKEILLDVLTGGRWEGARKAAGRES
jgi:hypothetical protein